MYRIDYTDIANKGLAKLLKSDPKSFKKALAFIDELKVHPTTGTGHPEPLKGQPENRWSRRISQKHRLVYRIFETEVVVLVISSYGHYDDK